VLRQGIFSPFLHGVVEYVAGVVFLVAPFVLDFESNAAKALSIVVGVVVLVVTASSQLPTGLAKVVPVTLHAIIDVGLAVLLIASPFLFEFSEDGVETAFFIALGVIHLLLTIGTRFLPAHRAEHT
jgi:uncharacterized membrane protein (UPF0136 family)